MSSKQFKVKRVNKESQGHIDTTLFVAKAFLFNSELSHLPLKCKRTAYSVGTKYWLVERLPKRGL